MKLKQLLIVIVLCLTSISFAQNKNQKATIEVDGVCGMCKSRIEKAAIRTKGVKSAVWSIETHELKLIYDERKTNLENISRRIAEVGHDTKQIKATNEAYESIHACCKYRDEEMIEDHKAHNSDKNKNK